MLFARRADVAFAAVVEHRALVIALALRTATGRRASSAARVTRAARFPGARGCCTRAATATLVGATHRFHGARARQCIRRLTRHSRATARRARASVAAGRLASAAARRTRVTSRRTAAKERADQNKAEPTSRERCSTPLHAPHDSTALDAEHFDDRTVVCERRVEREKLDRLRYILSAHASGKAAALEHVGRDGAGQHCTRHEPRIG